MKTIGIGVDIIDNKRIKLSIKNKKFINRIFAKNEIIKLSKIQNKISYLSKRFAAKEALAKALGTGFRNGLNYRDIQILNNKIKDLIKKKKRVKNFNLFLSISDEKDYSIAFTIIQSI